MGLGLCMLWMTVANEPLLLGQATNAIEPSDAAAGERGISPEEQRDFQPERIVKTKGNLWYGLTVREGFLVSEDKGATWNDRNTGLPHKTIFPAVTARPRRLTALGVDPVKPERVAVTTSTGLYLSEDTGKTWRAIALGSVLNGGTYLTAVALSSHDGNKLMVGTAFSGIFESTNAGKSWTNISKDMSFLYQGSRFWEEISALAYHPVEQEQYLFSCGFGHGLYTVNRGKKGEVKKVELPEIAGKSLSNIYFRTADSETALGTQEWVLYLAGLEQSWIYQEAKDKIILTESAGKLAEVDPARAERLRVAANRFGIYLRPGQARGKQLDKHIEFLKANGLDTIVTDFKDDSGYLTYATGLELPKQAKAVKKIIDAPDLLKKAKANGIYVIARVVVFKDQKLYEYAKNKYAVWDGTTDGPWGHLVETTDPETKTKTMVQREYWVDSFSPEVWEYNLAIAEELLQLGVDEIQFDYIRFPTDGAVSNIRYRHQKPNMEKSDALESFLALARSRLSIPISTDLYGFNCWYRMEGLTGQNIEMIADYVDVVAPMYYPSHFPKSFVKDQDYLARAKYLYYEGTRRAALIVGNKCLIRPYVQAFLLGGERRMKEAAYSKYLTNQIEGAIAAPGSGFTLWNNSNKYYMVTKPIFPPKPVQSAAPEGDKAGEEKENLGEPEKP